MAFCQGSLFGAPAQYIKVINSDFVAVDGSNTLERLMMADIRIPYKQILKGRVYLKEGQTNYLLNFLGLGDNATFLAMKATYNAMSVNEEDNYINWNYFDDYSKIYAMDQLMVLTGNSTNRIKQLYLTNPNTKYGVSLDIMVGVIDNTYTFYGDPNNQTGTSLTGLEYTDIKTHVVGESIVIYDKSIPARPLIYIILNNINSIEISGSLLIIDDSSQGTIFLQFISEFDANQANSLLNYIMENPDTDIDSIPQGDLVPPIIYFNDKVIGTDNYIMFDGATMSAPYDTSFGNTFSTTMSFVQSGTASGTVFDKSTLRYLLIDNVFDNRDGDIYLMDSNIIINDATSSIPNITTVGTYSVTFSLSDIGNNTLDNVFVTLNITD